jgi:hypothetical protein
MFRVNTIPEKGKRKRIRVRKNTRGRRVKRIRVRENSGERKREKD